MIAALIVVKIQQEPDEVGTIDLHVQDIHGRVQAAHDIRIMEEILNILRRRKEVM